MRPRHWATERSRRRCHLAAATAGLAALWLVVLPLLGSLPAVRRHIQRNQSLGIDPSAKFYTELPAMPALAEQAATIAR